MLSWIRPLRYGRETNDAAERGLSRRELIVASTSAAGLLVGCRRVSRLFADPEPPLVPGAAELSPYVLIAPDGSITVSVDEAEMGQGVTTSLPMIVAEELRADFAHVKMLLAPSSWDRFGYQLSAASTSIREGWPKLRLAGARAREMLVAAAAETWGVKASECSAENSTVTHAPSGRSLGYGALAARAAKLRAPSEPALTDRARFTLIGKPVPRLDVPAKVDGSAVFGSDIVVPGMLTAVVARPPSFGARLLGFDPKRALAVPGVRSVGPIDAGICVIADHTWAALEGRKALEVRWDRSAFDLSSAEIEARLAALAGKGTVARDEGDAGAVLAKGERVVEAAYLLPYLAHAAMEPMNATASVTRDAVTVWAPTQGPTWARQQAAKAVGADESKVVVHPTFMGGGFGRRSDADFVVEAAQASKLAGAPVKVIWSREDDTKGGGYRPIARHVLRAALDARGFPIAWSHDIASPKIGDGDGYTSVEGAKEMPYAVPAVRVRWADLALPIRTGFWRSVGHSHNAFAVECFADELAQAAGVDPVAYRRQLLQGAPRHLAVLEAAASRAGWGSPLAAGRARGVAVHASFGSYVAQVAEVSIERGAPRVHRVVCAIDCGEVVNPDTVAAQMEGGIVFGLSAALHHALTIAGGAAVEGNFGDYPILRMHETPAIEVLLVPGGPPIGGVGETAVPPIAPAVANAVRALTGQPVRRLPIRLAAGGAAR